ENFTSDSATVFPFLSRTSEIGGVEASYVRATTSPPPGFFSTTKGRHFSARALPVDASPGVRGEGGGWGRNHPGTSGGEGGGARMVGKWGGKNRGQGWGGRAARGSRLGLITLSLHFPPLPALRAEEV